MPECRLVPQTNAMLGSVSMTLNGMTSTLAHNFAKDATVLTAVKKLPGGQGIKASYGLSDKMALVEIAQAPFMVRPLSCRSQGFWALLIHLLSSVTHRFRHEPSLSRRLQHTRLHDVRSVHVAAQPEDKAAE